MAYNSHAEPAHFAPESLQRCSPALHSLSVYGPLLSLLQLHNPVQLRYLGEPLSSNSDQHTLLLLLQFIRYNTAAIAELAVIMPGSRPTDNTYAGPQ